jgi:hypothetical protein
MGLHIVRQTVIGVLLLMALIAELTFLATAAFARDYHDRLRDNNRETRGLAIHRIGFESPRSNPNAACLMIYPY